MKVESNRTDAPPSRQRGIAAIEFAFIFAVLLLVLYGIATFGAVLYVQQVVSRAAEDGARAVTMLPSIPLEHDPRIQDVVHASLAAALIVPSENSGSPADRLAWIKEYAKVKVLTSLSDRRVEVSVAYDYRANRMLPLLSIGPWTPEEVVGRATAVQPTEASST